MSGNASPDSIRLAKYLALCGVASRRKAEEFIRDGRVSVNGKTIREMGVQVDPERDTVKCDGKPVCPPRATRTLMLNKPPGVTTTVSDPHAERTVMQLVSQYKERLFPAGRLDCASEGLLIMTNDGELAFRLTHPKHHLDKEYEVVVEDAPRDKVLDSLRNGILLDGKPTGKTDIRFRSSHAKRRTYTVVLSEGRNRQIRRMFESVGATVAALRRVRIGPVRLGHLPLGAVRDIKGPELQALREAVGLAAADEET